MKLDIEELAKSGGFAGAPVKREVKFTNNRGEEVVIDVWVRRLSYQTLMGDIDAYQNKKDMGAARIASTIVNEDGDEVFKPHDVLGYYEDGSPVLDAKGKPRGGMSDALSTALLSAISEVNGLGKSKTTS